MLALSGTLAGMTTDPGQFLSAALTLSPVLLLTVVLVNRQAARNISGWKGWVVTVFLVGPAYPVMLLSALGLVLREPSAVLLVIVFVMLVTQIASSLASFVVAVRDTSTTPG